MKKESTNWTWFSHTQFIIQVHELSRSDLLASVLLQHEVDVPDDDAEQEKPLSSSEDDCIGLAEMENIEISDECGHKLEGLFELHNGESGCYAAVALEMGEDWTEALVKAACKKRNLKRGRLTANQVGNSFN